MRYLAFSLLALTACADETITGYQVAGTEWQLEEISGMSFPARAMLRFPEPGRIAGEAPCNSFSGALDAIYPWFKAGPLVSTKRACPDLAAEGRFFAALEAVTLAEISGPVMVLSNEQGLEMVFRAD